MTRNGPSSLAARSRETCGFTLLEIMTVCAVLGILAVMAFPSLKRFNREQATRAGATQMAGVLEQARSQAVSEATPYLVFVNVPGGGGGGSPCGAVLTVVRDTDRSYSITDGDKARDISLSPEACKTMKLYAQDETAVPIANLTLPAEDQSVVAGVVGLVQDVLRAEETSDGSGEDDGSEGSSSSGSGTTTARTAAVADAVVNGSTFPADQASGRPVIAFSERGIPVDPERPTSWGSGAGGIYLTDGADAVFAVVVAPMGGVKLRKFDGATGAWR